MSIIEDLKKDLGQMSGTLKTGLFMLVLAFALTLLSFPLFLFVHSLKLALEDLLLASVAGCFGLYLITREL
jgi:hypothetical protein